MFDQIYKASNEPDDWRLCAGNCRNDESRSIRPVRSLARQARIAGERHEVSFRQPSILPGFGLTLGFSTFFLCAVVLIPLAALVMKTATMGWSDFVDVLLDPRAVASYRLTFGAALLAALHQRRVRFRDRVDAGAL